VEDIKKLTGLSMEGQDVAQEFQGSEKHDRKKGEVRLYEKYRTKRGGHGAFIDLINDEKVQCDCYLNSKKVVENSSRGECTLDVISVAKLCKEGAQLIWCKYLLTKMLPACTNMHERATYFIYDYFLVSFAMWKWKELM
jgi:hypothetical protein